MIACSDRDRDRDRDREHKFEDMDEKMDELGAGTGAEAEDSFASVGCALLFSTSFDALIL